LSVTLQDLTIKYGQVTAVENLTAQFLPGSTGLLGPNGAGKSSLIKALLGLIPLSGGSAKIFDHDVALQPKSVRQIIGYMPEDDCLIPGLTGIGMVQYAGELCGMKQRDAIQRAHEVLFLTGLEEARYRKVETYSQGMKQRIKLAQALVHDPRLLLLDEPTSGMDPRGRQDMLDLICSIAAKGKTSIILATHILVDVEQTCERLVIMHHGKIIKQENVQSMQGSYSGTFRVRVAENRQAFENRLKKQGCTITPEGQHLLDIKLPAGKDTDLILEAAHKEKAQLRKLQPSVQTLEDVFVKLIAEDTHANL